MTETKKKATKLRVSFPHLVNGKMLHPGDVYDSPSDEYTRVKLNDGHVQLVTD